MSDLSLGWPTLCLAVKDLAASQAFCAELGFRKVGGDPSHGYVVLAAGPVELSLMGFLTADMLNLRGGDVAANAGRLEAAGLRTFHIPGHDPSAQTKVDGPRAFNPEGWPDSWLTGPDGSRLPTEGSGDFLVEDPDGNRVYFDTVPAERARHRAGGRFAAEGTDGSWAEGAPVLGLLRLQRRCQDAAAGEAFYEKLGLVVSRRDGDGSWMDGPFRVLLGGTDALLFEGSERTGTRVDPEGRRWVFRG